MPSPLGHWEKEGCTLQILDPNPESQAEASSL